MAGTSKHTAQEKVEIVLMGLKSPRSISELCRKHNISPNTYTRWKRNFVNGGMDALKPGKKSRKEVLEKENEHLKKIVGQLFVELEYLKKTLEVIS